MFEIALSAAFVGGLAGGLHCAGMCGGIVRVLCAAPGSGAAPQWPHLLAYNGGRIFSYVVAGALAGAQDRVVVIATEALTRDETWTPFATGELGVFVGGERIG